MFLVKLLWVIYALVQIECILQGTYFTSVEMTVDTKEAIKQIPNSSTIACILACKNNEKCQNSSISQSKTYYLFNATVNTEKDSRDTITFFKMNEVLAPGSSGTLCAFKLILTHIQTVVYPTSKTWL